MSMQRHPELAFEALNVACEETRHGILVHDRSGAVLKANSRFAAIFALPVPGPDDPVAALLDAMSEQLAEPRPLAALRQAIVARPGVRAQAELNLACGRMVDLLTVPLDAAGVASPARIWLAQDLTEQRNVASRLREEEEKFRSMLEQGIAGVCIADHTGALAYANPAFARFFGRTPGELRGKPVLDYVPSDQRDHMQMQLAALLSGQQDTLRITYALADAKGRLADLQVRASPTVFGGRPAVIAIVLDVTEQEQARRELEFANIIIEQSPVVLFQATAETGFARSYVSHNIARFGYTPEQARNGSFHFPDCVIPADRPTVVAGLQAILTGSVDLFEQDYRAVIADGSIRWIHDRTVPIRDATGKTVAFRGTMFDITERKQAEHSLARANRILRTLSSGNEVLVRAASERQLLDDMCRVLVDVGGYPLCWIAFAGPDERIAAQAVALRHSDACPQIPPVEWLQAAHPGSAAADAIAGNAPVIRRDPAGLQCPGGVTWRRSGCDCSASAAFPFQLGPAPSGVIVLGADMPDAFDPDECRLLGELASDLGYGIRALRAHAARDTGARRLHDIMHATIQALVTTLEQRDQYTAGHQRRVAALSEQIARLVGATADDTEGIILAALVHDVGKVRIPSELLSKPGRLTALEFQLVQTHAEAGYEILKGIDFPWPVARMVLQHHERLDGSGYPYALHGSEILPGSRIIAVADVVESMMTHRPYRPALGQAVALAEIAMGKGTRFDAAAVEACIALFEQHGFELPKPDGG